MRFLLQRLLLVALIFQLMGGGIALRQMSAWYEMTVERLATEDAPFLRTLFEMATVAAPCERCLSIREDQQEQQDRNGPEQSWKKIETPKPIVSQTKFVLYEEVLLSQLENTPFTANLSSRKDSPPTPPPREIV